MFPNSRRSTLNSGCLLEDLEPSGNNLGQSVMTTSSSPSKTMNEGVCTNQLSAEDVVYKPRQNSAASLASTLSISADFCKICHCGGEPSAPLITPCFCSGSLKHVHQECLQKWIKSSDIKRCELCKYPFAMQSKVKPFCQWEKLDMSSMERRKLVCSVTFHVVAITCVVWSLYILIDRTADEIKTGDLKWPFWTKLVVVAIGFTGGLVFMYIQCKVYVHLCRKWKAYNRIIVVQEAPEGIQKPSHTSNKNIESCSGKEEDSCQSDSRSVVVATSTAAVSSKSNAETQTALRGVSIVAAGELKNATKIFKEIDHEHPEVFTARSPAGEATTFFFEECDCERDQDSSCSQAGTPSSTSQKQTAKGKGNRKSSSKNRRRTSESCTTDECQNAGLSQGDLPGSTLDLEAASRNDEGSSL